MGHLVSLCLLAVTSLFNYKATNAFQLVAPWLVQPTSNWIVVNEQRRFTLSSQSRTIACRAKKSRRAAAFQVFNDHDDDSSANRNAKSIKDTELVPSVTRGADVALAPADELSEERRASLFQFLLRDLQVEGVPLLSVEMNSTTIHNQSEPMNDEVVADICSAGNFAILQAALWTTMAELVEQNQLVDGDDVDAVVGDEVDPVNNRKACLVVEDVRVEDLRRFIDFFETKIKSEDSVVARYFPEIRRMRLSLVGKGIGPALLMEVVNPLDANSSSAVPPATDATTSQPGPSSEGGYRAVAAMKMFVDRTMPCESPDEQSAERNGDAVIQYRTCFFSDIFHIQSSFWNCMCEVVLLGADGKWRTDGNGSEVLTLFLLQGADSRGPGTFEALTLALSQSVQLYSDFANRREVGTSLVQLPVEVQYFPQPTTET